jgi:NAD(P)-dependent dehydrogenase (short-subunit alcohol dehydrogenase family)
MPLDRIEAGLANMCPLKRVAVPADIGRVVAFLASEEGEWINGMSTVRHHRNQADSIRSNNQA